MGRPQDVTAALASQFAEFQHDPLGFVRYAYDWGHGPLADWDGPDKWQIEVLESIGEKLRLGEMYWPIKEGVGSGNGIGKSTLVCWLIDWAQSTFMDTRGVVTADTEVQLRTKTWSELAKWHHLSLSRNLFTLTATSRFSKDPEHEKTWRIDATPWSAHRPEGFAGLHNKGKRVLMIYDEASGIDDSIWDYGEGCTTDAGTEIIWCAFGNRTRSEGKFHQCFSSNRWKTRCIDSRTAKASNKNLIKQWAEDYGEDSDFFKVRVLGEAPRVGDVSFFNADHIIAASRREIPDSQVAHYPVCIGVDVARYGGDVSVVCARRGRKMVYLKKYSGVDAMTLANFVVEAYRSLGSTGCICVDGIGVGAGVVDRLKQLRLPVVDVNVGTPSTKPREFGNLRAELYSMLRDWLPGAQLIRDDQLISELRSIQYGYNNRLQLMMEKKDDMKRRGVSSPDHADGLMLTFANEQTYKPHSARVIQVRQRQTVW